LTNGSIADKLEKSDLLYETLKGLYNQVLERRKTLTGQASSLLTFGGIIQTILVGLITTLATNSSAKTLLSQNSHYSWIVWAIGAGFVFYILTAVAALCAFVEPKWDPAPVPLLGKTPSAQKEELMKIYADPTKFSVSDLEVQLINATSKNQETNTRKFRFLFAGYIFLFLGIEATAIAGILLISGVSLG
jgi:hypothetical protein